LSEPRKVEADAQAVDQLGRRQARGEDLALEVGDVLGVDQLMIDGGHRVLPDQLLGRDLRAEVARAGPMSRWVSLNQARAKASANSSGFSWKRREIFS
jgi:hypothetical protein